MKIIQIRGVNGCGKTTVVRQYIQHNKFEAKSLLVGLNEIKYYINDENVIIIGDYSDNGCGGCDKSIRSGDELKNTIAKIARVLKPAVIVFEGVMYGMTFSFSYDIYKLSKALKSEFIAICLISPFEVNLERIYERNGGKEINVQNIESKWKACFKANQRLKVSGVTVKEFDTSVIAYDNMYKILEEEI